MLPTPQLALAAALPLGPPAHDGGLATSCLNVAPDSPIEFAAAVAKWPPGDESWGALGYVHLCKVEGCCGERPESHEADGFAKPLVAEPACKNVRLTVSICRTATSLCGQVPLHIGCQHRSKQTRWLHKQNHSFCEQRHLKGGPWYM